MLRCASMVRVRFTGGRFSKSSMAAADTKLGPWGEALAAAFLRKRGYHIVATNYRSRYGEIDIIAEIDLILYKDDTLVFAEVKLRRTAHFGAAREFVDLRKQERLRATASMFLEEHETALQPRFDVIEIYAPDGLQTRHPYLRQIEDAFYEI